MIIKNVTKEELEQALQAVNVKYSNNITWEHIEPKGKNWDVRLRVKNSKGPGARLGFKFGDMKQRHLINACWHVHGFWYDALFAINPNAVVVSMGKKITKDDGNWEDRNIGSIANPMYYSEACMCNETGLDKKGANW